ncbi:sn-1,2-diacylglycerol cholinephosphotransferase [Ascosphaera apis ARSEF 7405]|uniref:diacylglycerol cholinephosphotransferase n=1 Tax=Ascosphaera apis ARSEF 7405 TaxID=392613 RepID=A0A168CQV1_9EURO|nr:sn-1,2-diacylglycerol cholinephosphotransferase [Ascosphaera apis ARSEF 7405]
MGYIRQQYIHKLKEYKYSGVDHSLVSRYILKPFYQNVVIKCFPMWMAPNLITLTGLGFVVFNVLTLLWFNPTLDQDCPSWVYASWAIGLFLYQTFDAVDGAQARRTHQSGPLGELFDHGVDAVNTVLEALIFCGVVNLGQSWKTIVILWGSVFTFYIQTWEEYHTHTLTLGIVSGPVEGVLILCAIYGITASTGGSFWHQAALPTLGIPQYDWIPDVVYQAHFTTFHMIQGASVCLFNVGASIAQALNAVKARGGNRRQALKGLLPALEMWVLVCIYLYLQPGVLHCCTIGLILYIGLMNAFSVSQMICAHVTKAPFPYRNILTLPLYMGIIDSLGRHLGLYSECFMGDHSTFIYVSLGIALGVYGSFVYDVITSICDYLDIWCLQIKHPYNENNEAKNK